MLKVRAEGVLDEVKAFGDALESAGVVLNRSRPYRNRGGSGCVRVYLDVDAPFVRSDVSGRHAMGIQKQDFLGKDASHA